MLKLVFERPAMTIARLTALLIPLTVAAETGLAQGNPLTEPSPGAARQPQLAPQPAPDLAAPAATDDTATAIIRSLAPIAGQSRSVREVEVDDGGQRGVRVDYARAVDLTVFFAYDSARLTAEAQAQLDPLGRALASPALLPHRFLLAGHTDASGDARYNKVLSLRRALAVREHLVATYGVDPQRLVVHGWGEEWLKAPGAPHSGINRRVEVALIVPQGVSYYHEDVAPACEEYVTFCDPRRAHAAIGDPLALYAFELFDPRLVLGPSTLDDFAAAPTPLAGQRWR